VRSLLILQSLGFAKSCKFLCVCNLDFLIEIHVFGYPIQDFVLESSLKGFMFLIKYMYLIDLLL
jgi:hypothetical protein